MLNMALPYIDKKMRKSLFINGTSLIRYLYEKLYLDLPMLWIKISFSLFSIPNVKSKGS